VIGKAINVNALMQISHAPDEVCGEYRRNI